MEDSLKEHLFDLGHELEDISQTQQLLSQYFDNDEERRFHMEGLLGAGQFGFAWKLRYQRAPPSLAPTGSVTPPDIRHIILKTDQAYVQPGGEDDEDEEEDDSDHVNTDHDDVDTGFNADIWKEKRWLKVLEWAKHVVRDVTPPRDPLAQRVSGIRSHHMKTDDWVYLEWLENGTLKDFMNQALEKGIAPPLPNRLLWRIFLCLIRMCIAMAFPPRRPPGDNPQPVMERVTGAPYGGLIHDDMHLGNLMFGDMIPGDPDLEHSLTPILKLIDFGSMRMVTRVDEQIGAIQANIFDIGASMAELVTFDNENAGNIYPSDSKAVNFRMAQNGPEIRTNGGVILPKDGVNPYPRLDPTLRTLICACLAVTPGNRPGLPALTNMVRNAVISRDAQFYANNGIMRGESDGEIQTLVNDLILNA